MCTNIAKNIKNGNLKQSFFECCNITRPTIRNEHESKQNTNSQKCPTGYEYNAQGLYEYAVYMKNCNQKDCPRLVF